jgi:hypothetical protein
VEGQGRFLPGGPSCGCLFREGLAEIPKEDSKVSDDRDNIKKDESEHEDVEAHVKHKGFTDSDDDDAVEAHVKQKG